MIALVTGGNRGIGREVSRQPAALGNTVVVTARSLDAATAAATDIEGDVLALRLDVTDEHDIATVAAELTERYGRFGVLINNAAIMYDACQRASSADLNTAFGRPVRAITKRVVSANQGSNNDEVKMKGSAVYLQPRVGPTSTARITVRPAARRCEDMRRYRVGLMRRALPRLRRCFASISL
jgi:NAD(P)-dependent dehydrogenase (short-subunit alcohol dehydrogenase family)